jgi:hypothetical protein
MVSLLVQDRNSKNMQFFSRGSPILTLDQCSGPIRWLIVQHRPCWLSLYSVLEWPENRASYRERRHRDIRHRSALGCLSRYVGHRFLVSQINSWKEVVCDMNARKSQLLRTCVCGCLCYVTVLVSVSSESLTASLCLHA